MAIFYVFQGVTYEQERKGGYVWSPQVDKSGRQNAGYKKMQEICKGDFILHNYNGKIMSLSIAKDNCQDANLPNELTNVNAPVKWGRKGFKVELEYLDFDVPIIVTEYKDWLRTHYSDGSAFTKNGTGKQQYMCSISDEHAIFLINKAIEKQQSTKVKNKLKDALSEMIGDRESEYNQTEKNEIANELAKLGANKSKIVWEDAPCAQELTQSSHTGRQILKRDAVRAAKALVKANYKCEYDDSDRTFLRKDGTPYTEPHHLIPVSKFKDFKASVDVMANIVSLCSHCHNLLHYGRYADKEPILEKLYNARKDALAKCGLNITLDELKSYYK